MCDLDPGFLEVLASCANAKGEVDYSDGWKPPDGTYTCSLVDVRSDTKEKDDGTYLWVKPLFRIVDGDLSGRSFADPTSIRITPPKPGDWKRRRLFRFAQSVAGRWPRDLDDAVSLVRAAKDALLRIEVKTRKKDGREYHNVYYRGHVPGDAVGRSAVKKN